MSESTFTGLCQAVIEADQSIEQLRLSIGKLQEARNRAESQIIKAVEHLDRNEIAVSLESGMHRLNWQGKKISLIPMMVMK